jgi:oligogalacturonide transport system ATP-binding protein
VGRAIVKKPEVFLFDEPLSNLDAKLRAAMRVRLTELHRSLRDAGQPATTIYVTHDQTEAMTMGERICVLKAGVIQQVDTPTALYDRPANAFVASFIGSPEMNIVNAALADGSVQLGGVSLPLPARRFKARANGAVQFGLRPEHIGLSAKPGSTAVQAKIKFCEHMGAEVFIYFDVGGVPFSARLPAEDGAPLAALPRGAALTLYFQMNHAHLFVAADDGASLLA